MFHQIEKSKNRKRPTCLLISKNNFPQILPPKASGSEHVKSPDFACSSPAVKEDKSKYQSQISWW